MAERGRAKAQRRGPQDRAGAGSLVPPGAGCSRQSDRSQGLQGAYSHGLASVTARTVLDRHGYGFAPAPSASGGEKASVASSLRVACARSMFSKII